MSTEITDRVWLVTGCSSGFGRLLAERLHLSGERLVATARSLQSLRDLGREDESRILRLELDVTDPATIARVVARTTERFGRIDVLVNNAGYGYFGTQEEGEIDEVRRMFETNIFGLVQTTQKVLPLMRSQRNGTVVNISSVSGRIASPRAGFYQATKWGVEALSEALHLEVAPFGINVVVIEPGAYDTDFSPRSARVARADADPDSPYARLTPRWKERSARSIFPYRQDPSEVVDIIIDAVRSNARFLRIPVGRDATELTARRQELGDRRFVEWMMDTYNAEE